MFLRLGFRHVMCKADEDASTKRSFKQAWEIESYHQTQSISMFSSSLERGRCSLKRTNNTGWGGGRVLGREL